MNRIYVSDSHRPKSVSYTHLDVYKRQVRTNADTPKDARKARDFGAKGVGLCRTEHMFFEGHRIDAMREMILSDTVEGRRDALNKILPMQRGDLSLIHI